ncbi:DUF1311 domain-containing protein [Comamonas sp. Y33R10-2]|uniref:lysozyme inhibitor LprI family protein n=1 Tax=Comamonas sp. Y33R10-2 TaxID=2853257 RepID=UPI001C5CAD88|nr:lysozyme inhibitor LprI family protein [Comamonas sp. Y33R10-2]QXZ10911.1 DUF1311 domain-containing protein [Comamonas sp. Y33R10-2]
MPLRQRPFFRPLLTGVLAAVLWGMNAISVMAQEATAQPASSACDPATNWQANLQCLNEKTVFVDIALEHSLQKLNELLPPKQSGQLQTQQRDWRQRRDKDCTPTDRPASDSNALAYAALCRSQMALQRTELLESVRSTIQGWKGSSEPLCAKDDAPSLDCLQKQNAMIESSMQVFYTSIALGLPEQQAQKFHAEQKRWQAQREQSCQLNGYVHAQEDQVVCHTRMTLERLKVYKSDWWPLIQTQTQAKP